MSKNKNNLEGIFLTNNSSDNNLNTKNINHLYIKGNKFGSQSVSIKTKKNVDCNKFEFQHSLITIKQHVSCKQWIVLLDCTEIRNLALPTVNHNKEKCDVMVAYIYSMYCVTTDINKYLIWWYW